MFYNYQKKLSEKNNNLAHLKNKKYTINNKNWEPYKCPEEFIPAEYPFSIHRFNGYQRTDAGKKIHRKSGFSHNSKIPSKR